MNVRLRTHTSSTYCVTCKLHLLCLVASNGVTDNLVKYEKKQELKERMNERKKEDNAITGERERKIQRKEKRGKNITKEIGIKVLRYSKG